MKTTCMVMSLAFVGACGEPRVNDPAAPATVASVPTSTSTSTLTPTSTSTSTSTAAVESSLPNEPPCVGVERTVAAMRSKFKACYEKGLVNDPTMEGKVIITSTFQKDTPTVATLSSNSGLSAEVAECIRLVVKAGTFTCEAAGPTTLAIPVRFVLAGDAGSGSGGALGANIDAGARGGTINTRR